MSQNINFETDTIKVMLLNSNFNLVAKNVATLNQVTAIVGVEPTTSGYSRHLLDVKSCTLDNVNNLVKFNAANFGYASISGTISFRYLCFYKDTGVESTSVVLAIVDKGSVQTRVSVPLDIEFTNGYCLSIDTVLSTSFWTNYALHQICKQTINWSTDTIKVMLLKETYNLNTRQSVDFVNDLTGGSFEITGTNYSRKTLGTKSIGNGSIAANQIEFIAAAFTYVAATIDFRFVAIFKDTGVESTSPVLCIIDKGSLQSKVAVDVTINETDNIWQTILNP